MDAGRDAFAVRQSVLQYARVHVHVGHLAAGARTTVGSIDAHFLFKLIDGNAIARIAG